MIKLSIKNKGVFVVGILLTLISGGIALYGSWQYSIPSLILAGYTFLNSIKFNK